MTERSKEKDGGLERLLRVLDERLSDVVTGGAVPLPGYPPVALRVQELLVQGAGLAEVARAVGADSALAADVLRCANSPLYLRAGRVTTLGQAVTNLGAQLVLRLAFASGLAGRALSDGPLASLRRKVWMEGLASAAICQELARLRQLPGEKAFLLGLLHDFGKVVALSCLERLGQDLPARPAPASAVEALIERHHAALARELARRWGLPELLVEVIVAHHGEGTASDPKLLGTVVASDAVVSLMWRGPAVLAADLATLSGLEGLDEVNAIRRLVVQIPQFVAAFEVPVPTGSRPRSAVARPSPGPATPLSSPFPVRVSVARRPLEYRAVAIDRAAIVAEGEEPLPENQLFAVTLIPAPNRAFELWSLSAGMEENADGSVRVELRPYALGSELQARWAILSGGAPP